MDKVNVVQGRDLMIFVNGKTISLATNHSLTISADVTETASKDSGKWKEKKITKFDWNAKCDSLVSVDDEANSYDAMYDAMIAGEPVDIISGRPSNISDDGEPEGGWISPTTNYYKGKALITSLERNDPENDNSTMSIALDGTGKLDRVKTA
jgi:predicted secreted protein